MTAGFISTTVGLMERPLVCCWMVQDQAGIFGAVEPDALASTRSRDPTGRPSSASGRTGAMDTRQVTGIWGGGSGPVGASGELPASAPEEPPVPVGGPASATEPPAPPNPPPAPPLLLPPEPADPPVPCLPPVPLLPPVSSSPPVPGEPPSLGFLGLDEAPPQPAAMAATSRAPTWNARALRIVRGRLDRTTLRVSATTAPAASPLWRRFPAPSGPSAAGGTIRMSCSRRQLRWGLPAVHLMVRSTRAPGTTTISPAGSLGSPGFSAQKTWCRPGGTSRYSTTVSGVVGRSSSDGWQNPIEASSLTNPGCGLGA